MNSSISPSNNCLLAKGKQSVSTQFSQKKIKKQNFENNNFISLPNILSHIFSTFQQKKNYHTLIKHFEIMLSLVFHLACK